VIGLFFRVIRRRAITKLALLPEVFSFRRQGRDASLPPRRLL